ncbi:MAG TPA: hypothetical protein VGA61_14815 [Anaerolineae bacterium]
MGTNVVFMGWDRPRLGRERVAVAHFQEFLQYLGGLQQAGTIQSFDTAFLNPHGGDLNGFAFIRGDSDKLDAMLSSDAWMMHMTRAGLEMDGFGFLRGVTGDLLNSQMQMYMQTVEAAPA